MRRVWCRAGVCLLAMISAGLTRADDYVEDVYYWQDSRTQNAGEEYAPSYNKRAKEIVFIEDSSSIQHPDTVRALLR